MQIRRGLRPLQRVKELERQIGQIALGKAGQVSRQPHDFWVTLVKAAKKQAQAKAALLASVQAQQDEMILEASTRATIDALVGEGFSASRTLRDHVKRWADMIRAEYAGETRCDKAQLARAPAERLSATPDLNAEQQSPGGPSAQGHHRVFATRRCCRCFASSTKIPSFGSRLPRSGTRSSVRAALQRQDHHASHEAARS